MQPEIVFYTALPGPYPGEPQPTGARDYRELLGPKGGWTNLLKDRSCLVLCPPWGVWAPYVRTIEPENWSPSAKGMSAEMTWLEHLREHHGLQDLDPDGVGAFGEVDPGLIFQKELWGWAAKPTSTTVIVLPPPGPELPHRTGIGFAGHALLNHLIPNFGFRPSLERVDRDDLRDVEDEHRPWVDALGPAWSGSVFEPGEYSADAFLAGLRLEDIDDNFENSLYLLAQGTLPEPSKAPRVPISDLKLIAHPRGDEELGVAVLARVGVGHLVVVMLDPTELLSGIGLIRDASGLLHAALHRPVAPTEIVPPAFRLAFPDEASEKRIRRVEFIGIPDAPEPVRLVLLGANQCNFLQAIYEGSAQPYGVSYKTLAKRIWGEHAPRKVKSHLASGIYSDLHILLKKTTDALERQGIPKGVVQDRISCVKKVGYRWQEPLR